jgi:CubicO group peptidase (beta-lactamase class C family)
MRQNGVGVVVGVIEPTGRRIVAYGRSGAPDNRPLDGDTVFQIGSVSKTFVGLVLADMVLRKEVALDDPAAKYLPKGVSMPQRGRPITLLDLATHMSGFPPMPTNLDLQGQPDPIEAYSLQDLYEFLSNYIPTREPGVEPEYSNLGVSLLGRLLGLRANQEYADLLAERVLQPLGMHDTAFQLQPEQLKRLAPGHDKDLQPVHSPEMRTLYPSGSLRSTVNDLLTYVEANLGYKDTKLKQAMLYQRTVVRVPVASGPQTPTSPQQALGWKIRQVQGREIVYHDGGKQGYRSGVAFDPARRTGIVVLANARTDDQPIALARHLLAGEPLRPVPPPVPVRTFAKVDPKVLDSYAGQYRQGNQLLRVAHRDDRLLIDYVGRGVSELRPQGTRDFRTRADALEVTFTTDPNGKVTGLLWYSRGRDAGAPQEFARIGGQ